ncbi:hypothetical protein C5Z25_09835 [Lactobacillus sp. CBA3605]|uniref:DUF6681 family protein n=1 Tax=Lactobacillus sp. CBA3605 TaxID=2099788 RepID=UPI000CFC4698|nr:DUF6681 family protein [Lactobacillus sp. CBA3605]AVK62056.1 hypothetical protein C5Z25_09835 [Lactobacillus sp. CBA3605]
MFSILDMINHALGYVNVNLKIKNQIYIGIGIAGNIYLGYVAIRLMQNGAWLRGALYLLVFLVLIYFIVLNFIYYFTQKRAKYDLSPKIEKLLGGKPKEVLAAEKQAQNGAQQPYIPANGIFDGQELLPAAVKTTSTEQHNVHQIVDQLQATNVVRLDYAGLSDADIMQQVKATGEPVYAIGQGIQIPYSELRLEDHKLVIYAGLNQIDQLPVGRITRVGLTDVHDAHEDYKLYLASTVITGGMEKIAGRQATIEQPGDYQITAQVAFEDRQA